MNKYNERPFAWREISNEEFACAFFTYMKEPLESRQIIYDSNGERLYFCTNANLFAIEGTKDKFGGDGLGVALYQDGYSCKFAKYGSEEYWGEWESAFAAQFSGDNS